MALSPGNTLNNKRYRISKTLGKGGAAKFGKLYGTLDYAGIYNKPLKTLEREWLADLDQDSSGLSPVARRLPETYNALLREYSAFFEDVAAGRVDQAKYRQLDQRRLGLLRGQ